MNNYNAERIERQDRERQPKGGQTSVLVVNRIILRLTLGFVIIILVTGFLGFGNVPEYSWEGANILFYICLAMFLFLMVLGLISRVFRRRTFVG
jgi:uncharacterized membrane protein YtjA (UPF0391 family)